MRLAADIDVQVLSAGGRRPAVLLCPSLPDLALRLARAGYAVVSIDAADHVADVLTALTQGALGFEAAGVVTDVPYDLYRSDPDAAVRWCAEHLAC